MYLAGTYNDIDWEVECASDLGEQYFTCDFKETSSQKAAMSIERGIDDEFVLRIVETKRYILKVECDNKDSVDLPHFQNEENKFLKCDKDKDSILFQFINYLGRSKIMFDCVEGIKLMQFEVVPDKMDYEDDYIGLTEALAQKCSELLLEYSGSTSNVYSQSEDDQKTLLEQFIFLRQFCYSQNLQGLFESVKRNPDRILVREEEFKPFGYGKPSKKFYTNPFSYSKRWGKLGNSNAGSQIFLPQEVAVTQKYDSLDTPANRFVKFALGKFDSVCVSLIRILDSGNETKQAECLKEAKAMHAMLENIFRDGFFDDIGPLNIMPQNNQVLQKREGYSQIFSAYSMIDLALQLDWKGKDDVYEGESKNVALLYEYWLFFELYKIIKSIDGCEMVESKENPFLIIDDGITVSLEQGKKSCQSFEIKNGRQRLICTITERFQKQSFIRQNMRDHIHVHSDLIIRLQYIRILLLKVDIMEKRKL